MVDMDAVANSLWAKNNDAQLTVATGQQIGMMTSAWEHKIPEMLFTSEENPGEAVSAVKALAIASAEGQRIYQVTKENVDVVLPVLNIDSKVKDEIRDSVTVGKVATVSQNTITVGSWTGVGYIIADPETGAGAYRISGGSNGGWLSSFLAGFLVGITTLLVSLGTNPFLQGTIPALAAFILLMGLGMDTIMQGDSYATRFNLASIFLTLLDFVLFISVLSGLITLSPVIAILLASITIVTMILSNALAYIMLPLKNFFVYRIQNDEQYILGRA